MVKSKDMNGKLQRIVIITMDMENDPLPETYQGLKFLPKFCEVLDKYCIRATFFVTADVTQKFPDVVKRISEKHEIGCHGFAHENLSMLPRKKQYNLIKMAVDTIEKVTGSKPLSFRAPGLKANYNILLVLRDLEFVCDSSINYFSRTDFFILWRSKVEILNGLVEVPISIPYFLLNVSPSLTKLASLVLPPPLVIYFHPWQFMKLELKNSMRARISAGTELLKKTEDYISFLEKQEFRFMTMKEFSKLYLSSI